jgi:DNA repair protein RecO (recombination protein O)
MNLIAETEAFVLTKIDFGDTSNIVSLFTKEFGKISAIVKGGKSGKAGKARIIDPPNYLQVMLYNKPSRDVQLISGAEIIAHYPKIKDDLEKLKYSYAVIELIRKLLPEHEPNHRIFKGIVRIFELFEISQEFPEVTFGRFFLFLMKESGYEVQLDKCTSCGKTNLSGGNLAYNFDFGILCEECGSGFTSSFGIEAELFRYLICLKNNLALPNPGKKVPGLAINFMEKYLRHHIPGFSGIQTFQIFK